jgi:hypothetical protein
MTNITVNKTNSGHKRLPKERILREIRQHKQGERINTFTLNLMLSNELLHQTPTYIRELNKTL